MGLFRSVRQEIVNKSKQLWKHHDRNSEKNRSPHIDKQQSYNRGRERKQKSANQRATKIELPTSHEPAYGGQRKGKRPCCDHRQSNGAQGNRKSLGQKLRDGATQRLRATKISVQRPAEITSVVPQEVVATLLLCTHPLNTALAQSWIQFPLVHAISGGIA